MLKHIRNLVLIFIVIGIGILWYMSRPDIAQVPESKLVGTDPLITDGRAQTIPTMNVAEATKWSKDGKPVAASGLVVERFVGGLDHPRNMYVLPNGDVLVAETNSPPRDYSGIEGWFAKRLMTKAGATGKSANRITLLRDADGDGVPEVKTAFLTGLNSPFGMVLIGETLYVANTDAVLAFPYKEGDTQIAATGTKLTALNAEAPNNHWTKNLAASPDGQTLFIAVGSNSNIAENGLDKERGRAMVLAYDFKKKSLATYSSGLRNPVGLAWDRNGILWTVVNERDMLGSDMVPDYLTEVEFGADYGWPQHFWGGYVDHRVQPQDLEKRQYEKRPAYALGAHTAPLGLAFADNAKLGGAYADGAFVARHGSWNRDPLAGYDVIFVPFTNGRPTGKPVNILSGFLTKDGKAQGRPTMLAVAKDGSLLVSDDVGNSIWRVRAAEPAAKPAS